TVSIAGSSSLTLSLGAQVGLTAAVRQTSIPVTFGWSVNGTAAGSESVYKFVAEAIGSYTIVAKASNEDGFHSDTVNVEVLDPSDIPLEWEFERSSYHIVKGRKLHIAPSRISGIAGDGNTSAEAGDGAGVSYSWEVEGAVGLSGQNSDFVFVADAAGEYKVKGVATVDKGKSQITLTRDFTVTVYEEGAFYRQKNGSSKADWNKVFEYTPAPGQFINELKTGGFDGTQTTPEAAVAYAESRMSQTYENGDPNPIWVSLGGFGGYIVVGFDHSIDNSGDYDLGILGNSFNGSSEPGIVWVMQDENGNGLPDDNWYELAGSETGKEETIQNYSVTYYRPTGPGMPVQWTDSQGNSGEIDYLKTYHSQDYYYPLWIGPNSYTLTGTCLKARNYDASGKGSYWVNDSYDWGYVDNWSSIDRLTSGSNSNADANANHFKICNAIDFEGNPVNLKFVDFVKVQVGVNAKSGWLGEISTEVFGFYDYNMKK
ncbi:MAG: cell surface protein, partial [Bacteroidales bacterium]|nr:cell surface protein [Bacteroidales bacterium]